LRYAGEYRSVSSEYAPGSVSSNQVFSGFPDLNPHCCIIITDGNFDEGSFRVVWLFPEKADSYPAIPVLINRIRALTR
jgi:hypothetical protein